MDWHEKKKAVEDLLETNCSNDFRCMRIDDDTFTRIKVNGPVLECPMEKPIRCDFSIIFGYSHVCQCPVANFILKEIRDLEKIIEFKKFWNLKTVMEEARLKNYLKDIKAK